MDATWDKMGVGFANYSNKSSDGWGLAGNWSINVILIIPRSFG